MITTAAAACDDLLIPVNAPDVRQRFAQARQSGLRAKEAAESTGLHDGGLQVVPLRAQWLQVLRALQDCGTVMALTRNESTVHEKTGVYQKLSASGGVGLALGREIDLRLFFAQWHAGYAVTEQPAQAGRPATHSLQFFNAHGRAVHKVHARESTDMAAWDALVRRFAEPSAGYLFRHARPRALPQSDKVIDVHGLSAAWDALQDTHEFFDLLRRFGAERQQAFRLVPGHCARLAPESVAQLLGDAAMDDLPIMVFVDSGGCIQIHTGPVYNIQPMDTPGGAQWINVMDPDFNLHLRCDLIASVWAVQKPTADGVVTSVEAFDAQGDLMAMFFGERKPGLAELPGWRELVAGLPRLAVQTLA